MKDNIAQLLEWLQLPLVQRVIVIAVGLVLILVARTIITRTLNRTVKSIDNKYKARKAVTMLGYLVFAIVVLVAFSDKLGNIGVAMGVAGAGVAFALQEVIVSLAGWLYLTFGGTVGVGDRVSIGGIKGDIIDIGVFSTTVMEMGEWVEGDLYNGRIVTLANSFVFNEKVHNYSAEYPFLWDEIRVPIRTESDFELARTLFAEVLDDVCGDYARKSETKWKELANRFRVEEARVQPMVTLAFDHNWITLTLRYIVDFKLRRTTRDLIYSRLLKEIAATNGKVQIAVTASEVLTFRAEQGPQN